MLKPPNIPALSSRVDSEVKRVVSALKEWFTKVTDDGGFVTRDSLPSALASTPAVSALFDGTIPPQIQGFAAIGGFAKIMLTWDDPRYSNFGYVEIHRNTADDLGTAQLIGSSVSTMYPDTPPNASLAVTYYYWARIISKADKEGPYNATAGTPASTANDPAYALEILANQLTESQLHSDLNDRINLIDTPVTGLVPTMNLFADAVNTLIAAENERWERLIFEREVTDATVEISATGFCTLSAYTTEATCIAGGGAWRPPGSIRLKTTADITSDIDARLNTVEYDLNAVEGTVVTTVNTVNAHSGTISDYLTAENSVINQIAGEVSLKATSAYVDLTTDEIAHAADVATFAANKSIPEALAYLVLHNDDAARKLRGAGANIAIAQQDLIANANAVEAEATSRLTLAAKVAENVAALELEQMARADADSAEAESRLTLAATVAENGAAIAVEQQVRASSIAPDYSPTGSYAAGKCVMHGSPRVLYRNTSGETISNAGAWTGAGWEAITADLYASYGIKLDVNGHVSAIAMDNDGTQSKFIVSVDEFAVARPVQFTGAEAPTGMVEGNYWAKPDGTVWKYLSGAWVKQKGHAVPICVLTSAQTINGVTLDPGVYIDGASISHLTAGGVVAQGMSADNLVVPGTASIWDAILTIGKITNAYIGDLIQSTIYQAGVSGWSINKNGQCEFQGVKARGDIEATSIKADAVNVVDTLQIKGNAVTVPVVSTAPGPLIGTNVCSLVIPSSSFSIPYLLTVSFKAYTGSNNFGVTPTLKRDGVTIYAPGQLLGFSFNSPYSNQICFVVSDTPSANAIHNYTLDILDTPGPTGNYGVRAYSIVITAMGAKR